METIYNAKFVQSGDRLEVYKYRGYIRKGRESNNKEGRRGKKELSEEEKEINRIVSRARNLNNARNNIVRIVNSNPDLISFITITYADNMQDLKKSKKQLNTFFGKLKKDYEELKYVYVLEFQERGAIHYHILTNFPVPIKSSGKRKTEKQKEYERWFSKKYWKHGFVDCRNLKKEENTNVARYLSAYITTDLFKKDLLGHRIFTTSRNINRPTTTTMELKCPIENIETIDGYDLTFNSSYEIAYTDKSGKDRHNSVNYYDFKLKK